MKRHETRYTGVWDAAYSEAIDTATDSLWRFLVVGGKLTADTEGRIWTRLYGTIWQVGNILALGDLIGGYVNAVPPTEEDKKAMAAYVEEHAEEDW